MKRSSLEGVYEWGLLTVLFLVVLHAPLSVGFGSLLPEYATTIKGWKELALGLLAVVAVAIITRRGKWSKVANDRIIQLSAAYLWLHLILVAVFRGDIDAVLSGLLIDLRYVGMFVLTYVLISIRPESLKNVVRVVAAGAAAVLGFGLLQITVLPDDTLRYIGYSRETITPYTTIDSNPDYVRINSTLRGPNPLGAICVMYAVLAAAYVVRRRGNALNRRTAVAAFVFIASIAVLFASFSRSAFLAAIVAIGLVALASSKFSRRMVLIGLSAMVVVGGLLATVSSTDWFSNVILHEDPESVVVDKSNDGHIESLATGAGRMLVQPLGAGIGSTGSASLYDDDISNDTIIENIYFFIAHESGWLGLALFLALFGVIMARLWNRRASWLALGVFASGIGLALIGVLLPVWADETVALVWWGLAGATIGPISGIMEREHATRARKQTSTRTT